MTLEIAIVLAILAAALVLFITERLRMDLVALMVLGTLALTGLVTPQEALSGFSNPAVVTVWGVFILSGALSRTGIAGLIGDQVLRLAGSGEGRMVAVIMLSSGLMSAFMNNVGVVALLLPVVMDIARRTGRPPSRLLMPLAYGCLLGGLTTLIGTPPNILVSEALREADLVPFRFFDFSPVGVPALLAGTLFMVFIGRRLLPVRDVVSEVGTGPRLELLAEGELSERLVVLRLPKPSRLAHSALGEIRLGSALGLTVVAIEREEKSHLAPDADFKLMDGDRLLAQGRLDRVEELKAWQQLEFDEKESSLARLNRSGTILAEAMLAPASELVGRTLLEVSFRSRFNCNVLAIRRQGEVIWKHLRRLRLEPGDVLLSHGTSGSIEALEESSDFEQVNRLSSTQIVQSYQMEDWLFFLKIPADSALIKQTLERTRMGDALGLKVLLITGKDGIDRFPEPERLLASGDQLLVAGNPESLKILQGFQELEIEREMPRAVGLLESEQFGFVEVLLSPQTTLVGKTLAQLRFREKYGLTVLAIWREGSAHYTDLRSISLRFGDAMVLFGPREKILLLGSEPDFLVLSREAQAVPRREKAPVAAAGMALVLVPVLMGWLPIYISVVIGATFMVLTGCLKMDEAYRHIEWPAVFLIAGMLPLGIAMTDTGTAAYLAEGVVSVAGQLGPLGVVIGLYLMTAVGTFVVPTAALVVLMSPIVLNTAAEMGISPYGAMMALAMAASTSLTSPISHPANLLVMGPGGYRFMDYVRVGVPLTLLVLVVTVSLISWLWPLQAGG